MQQLPLNLARRNRKPRKNIESNIKTRQRNMLSSPHLYG